jgi:hypothetical protein
VLTPSVHQKVLLEALELLTPAALWRVIATPIVASAIFTKQTVEAIGAPLRLHVGMVTCLEGGCSLVELMSLVRGGPNRLEPQQFILRLLGLWSEPNWLLLAHAKMLWVVVAIDAVRLVVLLHLCGGESASLVVVVVWKKDILNALSQLNHVL